MNIHNIGRGRWWGGAGPGDGGAKDTQAVSLRRGEKKKEMTVGGGKTGTGGSEC